MVVQVVLSFRYIVLCAALTAILLIPPKMLAQEQPSGDLMELSVEDLMRIQVESVYGASKHSQKVTDAPASVTLITADEIRRFGYRTLGELLQGVPGFYVAYDRNYTYTALRGFGRTGDYNSRILLLLDGHRLNDNIYDQAMLGMEFPVSLDLIERVEIIHGPSSSLYGSNAFLTVIDVITKRASTGGPVISVTGGSQRTGRAEATYGADLSRDLNALLSAAVHTSRGNEELYFAEFDTPQTNHGIAQDADYERLQQFFGSISSPHWRLQGAYANRKKGIPTASFGSVFNDSRAWTVDRREFLDLGYTRMLPKSLDVASRVYLDRYVYEADYPYQYSPGTEEPVVLNRDVADGRWWGEEVKVSKPLFRRHRMTAGNEFRHNFRQEQRNFDRAPFFSYLDDRRNSTVWAFYGQDEITLAKSLLLTLGVRHDRDSVFGGTTNPRVGVIYNPASSTTLKLLYGSAFRAPNAYELYYFSPASGLQNLNLQPETIRTAEIAWEQYIGAHYRLGARLFRNRIADLISQVDTADGLLQFQNRDSVRAVGGEVVLQYKLASGVGGQVNYTYQRSTTADSKEPLQHAPTYLMNASLLVPLWRNRLSAGLDVHYVSSRRTLLANSAGDFALLNVTLFNERLSNGLEISGTVYNLLNTKYGYPGGEEHTQDLIAQDGRTARLKVSYRFGRER